MATANEATLYELYALIISLIFNHREHPIGLNLPKVTLPIVIKPITLPKLENQPSEGFPFSSLAIGQTSPGYVAWHL